jgi:hypothetical protein
VAAASDSSLIIGLSGRRLGGINTPLGQQRLVNHLGGGELEVAHLMGNDGALMLGLQLGNQFGLEPAGLLGVQVAHFLWHVKKRHNGLVMALLGSLLTCATGTTNLNGKLLTGRVPKKLPGLLLDVLGGTRRLIHGPALLRALAIADLIYGFVALLDGLIHSLLFESDLADFFKVFFTHFLLGRLKLRHIGVVALFNILVCALKNGILLDGLDRLLLHDAAEARVGV